MTQDKIVQLLEELVKHVNLAMELTALRDFEQAEDERAKVQLIIKEIEELRKAVQ